VKKEEENVSKSMWRSEICRCNDIDRVQMTAPGRRPAWQAELDSPSSQGDRQLGTRYTISGPSVSQRGNMATIIRLG